LTPAVTFSDKEEESAAGFVLNKLYTLKCFAKRNNVRHGRHTELKNMQKGYPPNRRGYVNSACQRMKNKLVLVFRATGEDHICALNEDVAIAEGLQLCNRYRLGVGLPPLSRFFEEDRRPAPERPSETKRESDKERRSREYYERMKKWMDEQGLS
jgi:uncharacterized short protein YbdD (DUF466 family)